MSELTIKIEAPGLIAVLEKLTTTLGAEVPKTEAVPQPSTAVPVAPFPGPAAPVAPTAPVPTEQPAAPVAQAPAAVPVTAPTYTLDQIARAGASLVDAGKMEQLLALLARYGVAAVTQLQPDQFGVFATELRALGAQI